MIFLLAAITKIPLLKKILHEMLPFKKISDFAFKSSVLKSGLEEIWKLHPRAVSCEHLKESFGTTNSHSTKNEVFHLGFLQ